MKTLDFYPHVALQMNSLDYLGLSLTIKHPVRSVYFWMAVLSRIVIGVSCFIIPTVGQMIYLFKLMFSKNPAISEIAGVLNLVLTELLVSFKLLDLRLRRNSLKQVIEEFADPRFQHYLKPQQVILENAVRRSRMLFVVFLFSAAMDVAGHVIIAPGLNRFRSLPLKMDLIFFDLNDPKYYTYIFIYQIAYKPWTVLTYLVQVTLPWSAMSFGISQLDVLIYNFENMKELVKATMDERYCSENEAFRIVFRRQVQHHADILRFMKKVQAAFTFQLSSSLFMSACINGTTAMQFFSIDSPMDNITDVMWISAYFIIFILMLYVDTYFGNSITVKAAYLGTAVYSSPWLKLNTSMKKNLLIFIAKSQQPVRITAAKTIPISLETFTKVLNWTYKGFAILNQMK